MNSNQIYKYRLYNPDTNEEIGEYKNLNIPKDVPKSLQYEWYYQDTSGKRYFLHFKSMETDIETKLKTWIFYEGTLIMKSSDIFEWNSKEFKKIN
jgi:hypothetical protein